MNKLKGNRNKPQTEVQENTNKSRNEIRKKFRTGKVNSINRYKYLRKLKLKSRWNGKIQSLHWKHSPIWIMQKTIRA